MLCMCIHLRAKRSTRVRLLAIVLAVLGKIHMTVRTVTQRKRLHNPWQPVGRWIRPERRLALYIRDGYACVLCGVDLSSGDPRNCTLDHHVPRCQGGTNDNSNLYLACRPCNSRRIRTPKQLRKVNAARHRPMTTALDAAAMIIAMRKWSITERRKTQDTIL
jgi:5-methylcytosine-specific restriction endonuclease McrA